MPIQHRIAKKANPYKCYHVALLKKNIHDKLHYCTNCKRWFKAQREKGSR